MENLSKFLTVSSGKCTSSENKNDIENSAYTITGQTHESYEINF
jgi:hypothetical protein